MTTRMPVFSGNLFNTFTWRGITLSFNLAYSLGSKVRLFALYEPIISVGNTDLFYCFIEVYAALG